MKLTLIAGSDCYQGGSCPTVWKTEGDDLLVQGFEITEHGLDVPAGEDIVRLPRDVILAAAQALQDTA